MDPMSLTVSYFAILLGFGILIANVLKKRNIPDTFFLLLLGLLFSPTIFSHPFIAQYMTVELVDVGQMGNVPDFLRLLALILAVFTGTFNLNFRLFKKYSSISLRMAFIIVVLNTLFLGFVGANIFMLGLLTAIMLGAILGGTDSNVVFAFEKALCKSKRALTILKLESIFNDPVGILIPMLLLDFVGLKGAAMLEPMKYVSQFWLMITVGVGTGLLVGLSVSWFLKKLHREYGSLILFAIALITYALATGVGGSGILAVAVCGLVAGNFTIRDDGDKEVVIRFQDQFSEMLRISVFTMLGAQVTLLVGFNELAMMIVFFLLAFAVRPLFLLLVLGKESKTFSRKDVLLMGLVAPRGLAAAAMIPIVAGTLIGTGQEAAAQSIVNIVFIFILMSVLFSTIVAKIASMERFQKSSKEACPEEKQPPVSSAEEYKDLTPMIEVQKEKRKKG